MTFESSGKIADDSSFWRALLLQKVRYSFAVLVVRLIPLLLLHRIASPKGRIELGFDEVDKGRKEEGVEVSHDDKAYAGDHEPPEFNTGV